MRDDLPLSVPILIINLDRSSDRLAQMRAQTERLGLPFERFPAVDGTNVPAALAPYFCDASGRIVSPLAPGEIGCYASHLALWRHLVASAIPAALVCEDDAVLPEDLAEMVGDLLAALPAGWDMVHLCKSTDRAFSAIAKLDGGRWLIRFSRVPTTTVGYLISLSGAAKLLEPVGPRMRCVDWDLRLPWLFGLDIYGVDPPPITPLPGQSTIGTGRRSGGRRGLRASPFRTPSAFFFNLRKLGPLGWTRCLIANAAIKLRASLVPVSSSLTMLRAHVLSALSRLRA
jgi:glycosyl transferase family 25